MSRNDTKTVRAVSTAFRATDGFGRIFMLSFCIMVKIAFCDDDLSVLNEINTIMEQYQAERNQEIIYKAFRSPLDLLEETESGRSPDILFLDVMMPGGDGISVTRELHRYNSTIKVIFLTSIPEYAVDSYTVGAYFYQMKPVGRDRLFDLLDAAIADCRREQQEGIVVRSGSGIVRIPLERLEYCEVIGRELQFNMADGRRHRSSGSMEKLWSGLAQHRAFIRPHRSFLVHMKYIQSISGKTITMESQARIPIPHGKYTKIKEQYLSYALEQRQVFVL